MIDNRSGDPIYLPCGGAAGGASEVTLSLPGGQTMTLVKIPAGTFAMGSPSGERYRDTDEGPQHQVTLTRDFYISRTEVTQGQWQAVMGANPSTSSIGADYPVESVSWNDIAGSNGFIATLNAHLAATGQPGAGAIRLPTEAEWEYAARGGTTTRFAFGDNLDCDDGCGVCTLADTFMWWCGNNTTSGTKKVGLKQANQFGVHDMHGNVWEWTADWYDTYPSGPVNDPTGPASGSGRVVRGGSYNEAGGNARSASRTSTSPDSTGYWRGFRVARER